jgi:hypothetical protein
MKLILKPISSLIINLLRYNVHSANHPYIKHGRWFAELILLILINKHDFIIYI